MGYQGQPGQINPGQAYLGEFDNSYVLSEEDPVQFTKSYKIGHTLGRSLGRLVISPSTRPNSAGFDAWHKDEKYNINIVINRLSYNINIVFS